MISAIIVAYNPDEASFTKLLGTLVDQVALIVIVDNSDRMSNVAWELLRKSDVSLENCRFVRLGENAGVGAAINIGAEISITEGADFLLLSDQDSLPGDAMVARLLAHHLELSASGGKVGAIGPTYTDLHTERTYPFQTREPGRLLYTHRLPSEHACIEALTLITSGSLIAREAFLDVGPMREDFFIDYVDVEWCFRARACGYGLYGSGDARMFQRMGDKSLRVWYLRWRLETQYPPLRIYYRVRNHVFLLRAGYVSSGWKLRSSWFIAGVLYSHVLFGDQRAESWRMAMRGAYHGLIGKMGRLVN